jgi:hypothetical protein
MRLLNLTVVRLISPSPDAQSFLSCTHHPNLTVTMPPSLASGETPLPIRIDARIFSHENVSFAKFLSLPSWFDKRVKANFSYFAIIRYVLN